MISNGESEMTLDDLVERLGRIEAMLAKIVNDEYQREWYTVEEASKLLQRRPYTVREWCRNKRINSKKRLDGRGHSKSWMISRAEIHRIKEQGLLPRPKFDF